MTLCDQIINDLICISFKEKTTTKYLHQYKKENVKEAVRPSGKFRSFNPKNFPEFNGGDHFC